MVVFPPAKINLGLNVVRLRPDGYRDIETVMVPIPWHDVLEAIVDPALPDGEVVYTRSGIAIPGDAQEDLCMRAVRLVRERRSLPGLRVHLHKVVPLGAGLGGGSSDGAHMLMLLNDLLDLGLAPTELHAMACQLGSDPPFFLHGGCALAQGRGELLRPIALDLKGWWIRAVNPGIHVPTAEVYAHTAPTGGSVDLAALLLRGGPNTWRDTVINGMEEYVFGQWPEVAAVKDGLYGMGAAYAAMSGSGSTVFGLFETEPPPAKWPAAYRVKDARFA
jgi:4-diphosphocytidyl-2-C-methyl-D-erythritol kinase